NHRADYESYINCVHYYFPVGVKATRERIATDYKTEYDKLKRNYEEALDKYNAANDVIVEPQKFQWQKSLWNAITDEKEQGKGVINTLITVDIIAAIVMLVWWVVGGRNILFAALFFVFNVAIVALRVWKRKQNLRFYNEHCSEDNARKIEDLKKAKDDCLQNFENWKRNNPEWVDSSGNFRRVEIIHLSDSALRNVMNDAKDRYRKPVLNLYPKTYDFRYNLQTEDIQDNSAQFLAGIDEKIAAMQRERDALEPTTEKQIADIKRKISELESETISKYEQFMQERDIIDDLGFAAAKISDDNALADKILEQAQQRLALDHLLVGQRLLANLQNKQIPVFIPWQNADERTPGHILITCDNQNRKNALELARNLVVRMLAAFHPGLVHLSFLDPQNSNDAAIFRNAMKSVAEMKGVAKLYDEVKSDKITECIELLNAKLDEIQKILPAECSLAEYNLKHISEEKAKPYGAEPYEVVVIFDFQSIATNNNRLLPLIVNGAKHGIYLLVVSTEISGNNYRYDQIDWQKFIRINANDKNYSASYFDAKKQETENFPFLPIDENSQPLTVNGKISPALDRYFEKMPDALKKWEKENKVETDLEKFLKQPFLQINNDFCVPVGVSENKPFNFELDQEGNTHTFIIGATGSGKSVLLHDILAAAVSKYSPEELNLYLMDFKKGGVELGAYAPQNKGVIPHVKAALLDDCDRQVTMEILQQLSDEMDKRGKLFRTANKKNLSEYNKMAEENKQKRLPSIILAVDECHLLFGVRSDENQRKINQIVEHIATQGRSQGIHLIFATQTLAESSIPDKIMKNISNRFVLRAADSDARLMGIENSEIELKKLDKPGAAIYKTRNKQQMVQPDFLDENRLPELIEKVCEKAKEQNLFPQEEKFIFRGTWEPQVDKTLFKENPMTIGLSFSLNKKPLSVPILGKDGGDNLLIIGNKGTNGEAERNTLRIVTVSLLSLTEYYKQNNEKKCRILIINPSKAEIKVESSDFKLLDGRKDIEDTFVELLQRIDNEDTTQPDTFLYILGAQNFRDLKNDRKFNLHGDTSQVESTANNHTQLPQPQIKRPQAPQALSSAQNSSEISYSKCLEKILDNGAHCGIHVVLQTDKASNLFVDAYNINNLFSYMVLLGMPDADARKLTKTELPTEALPTEKERLKAIFFDDARSKSTTFVPFALSEKED
ncbi:MAG: DUF853 family protein, partial [Dysgonamonadaceae bacterium]|nr:DUF853 family protein [Dysgonamonadaceae bacterium]